jgi:hypothetical protein
LFADSFVSDSFVRATNFWFLVLLFPRKGPPRLTKARMEMMLKFLEKKAGLLCLLPLLILESQA